MRLDTVRGCVVVINSSDSDPAPDKIVYDVDLIPMPRQRLCSLLNLTMAHRASVTLYAADYDGDIRRDFARWVEAHPEHDLKVSETRVVTDYGWTGLITADSPGTHMRAVSIYYPTVHAGSSTWR